MGREICSAPSERWQHGAAMFNDSTMLIYGGFSPHCEDYCDDLWSYDFRTATELGGSGGAGGWMELIEINDVRYTRGETPGRRWKFSLISDGQTMYLFGGFRQWTDDTVDVGSDGEESASTTSGYLDDLWSYKKVLLYEETRRSSYDVACGWATTEDRVGVCTNETACHIHGTCCPLRVPTQSRGLPFGLGEQMDYGMFEELLPRSQVRDDGHVEEFAAWPARRAGHVATLDTSSGHCQRRMWIHGGFTSYFPYASSPGP